MPRASYGSISPVRQARHLPPRRSRKERRSGWRPATLTPRATRKPSFPPPPRRSHCQATSTPRPSSYPGSSSTASRTRLRCWARRSTTSRRYPPSSPTPKPRPTHCSIPRPWWTDQAWPRSGCPLRSTPSPVPANSWLRLGSIAQASKASGSPQRTPAPPGPVLTSFRSPTRSSSTWCR